MAVMTNALVLFALLGLGMAYGSKRANIPAMTSSNGTSKSSASAQYSHGNSSAPHLISARPAQSSVVRSSYLVTPPIATDHVVHPKPRPAVAPPARNIGTPSVIEVQATTAQVHHSAAATPSAGFRPSPQLGTLPNSSKQTISSPVTYPQSITNTASLISAQIAAASLTTASPVSRVKSAVLQQPTLAPPNSDWLLQAQTPIDRSFSVAKDTRYYPYNSLEQTTFMEPHISKVNQKYNHYIYHMPRHPNQYIHSSYSFNPAHSTPVNHYYNHQVPIDREYQPIFKPYPTKYVHFPPNRFPTLHNGLLKVPHYRPSYKSPGFSGSSSSGSLYYKILFPLALLGISIPALGMMYTYLNKRRRRRRDAKDFYSNTEDIEVYMQILHSAIELFQQNDFTLYQQPT